MLYNVSVKPEKEFRIDNRLESQNHRWERKTMKNKSDKDLEKKIEQNNKELFVNYLVFLIKKYKDKQKK